MEIQNLERRNSEYALFESLRGLESQRLQLTKQSEQNLNTLLNGSTELDDVARALNMLDVESQEGIIKAVVKLVVHSFMETGTFTESQPCEEETDEPND